MILKGLLLAGCLSGVFQLSGQSYGFSLALGGGGNYTLQGPKAKPFVAPLLGMPGLAGTAYFEGHYQWKNRIGLGVLVRMFSRAPSGLSSFSTAVEQAYPDYYVTPRLFATAYDGSFDQSDEGLFFLSYAFDKKGWVLQPRLMAGLFSYPLAGGEAVLKRRDTNEKRILNVRLAGDEQLYFHEKNIYGLGGSIEHHLWRRWRFFACADWTFFVNSPPYELTIQNQVDGAQTTESLALRSAVHMLNANVGIRYLWDKAPKDLR